MAKRALERVIKTEETRNGPLDYADVHAETNDAVEDLAERMATSDPHGLVAQRCNQYLMLLNDTHDTHTDTYKEAILDAAKLLCNSIEDTLDT